MNDVTFGITYFLRFDDLLACIASIKQRWPNATIDTQDTGGNLSRGRNELVQRCQTKYFFLLEEDMRLTADTDVALMQRVVDQNPDVVGCGGGWIEPQRGVQSVAGQFRTMNRRIVIEDANDWNTTNEGDIFVKCDSMLNFGLFRTETLKQYRWNESLEMAEDFEFYYRVQLAGVHRFAVCSTLLIHDRNRSNPLYRKIRRERFQRSRRTESRFVGNRYFSGRMNRVVCQFDSRFAAVIIGGDSVEAYDLTRHLPGVFVSSVKSNRLIARLPAPGRWRSTLGEHDWKLYCPNPAKAFLIARRFPDRRPLLICIRPRTLESIAEFQWVRRQLLTCWPFSVIFV